ncbi:MAG: amidoligase family protein [Bacteriovoracaceae bacterium]|nr:amidoligase family protein [Bacteriovoracaceae bacterium]
MNWNALIILLSLIVTQSCTSWTHEWDRSPASRTFGSCQENFRFLAKLTSNNSLSSTVGFEFEGAIPAQLTYLDVAKRIKDKAQELYPERTIELEEVEYDYGLSDYKVLIIGDEETLTISVKSDMSLSIEDKTLNGIEITSPIMKTQKDYMNFLTLLEDLKELNLKARQDVGGIHFHYGLPLDRTYADLVPLYEVFAKGYESLLNYFKANPGRGFQSVDKFVESFDELKRVAKSNPELPIRNYSVSQLHNRSILRILPPLHTWEIRFFNSTLAPEINEFYREFSDRLYSMWLKRDPRLQDFLRERESIEAKDLLSLLGFDTLETDRLMAKLSVEESELDQANPFDQEVKDFWQGHELPDSIKSPLFYRLILDDPRFNEIPESIQLEALRRARVISNNFPGLEEKIKLFELFKNSQDFPLNFKSFIQSLNKENLQYLYQAFHSALIRDGEELVSRITHLDASDQLIFFQGLLRDFVKTSQSRGVLKSADLKKNYLALMTHASQNFQNEEILTPLLKVFPIFQGLNFTPVKEFAILANNAADIILKAPKREYAHLDFLSFVNRNQIELKQAIPLSKLLKDLLEEKPNFNLFYEFSDFIKNSKEKLLTRENILFIADYATKIMPSLDRIRRVNLIILFKDIISKAEGEVDQSVLEGVLQKLRDLND